ncbi:hypothetical protein BJ085DRAFT_40345 [Dimargaris cristalligena]|uniref:Beige protein homolog 1 n=1 Tax=Dimargaris cristalligena TaxID=215637 RepID=A0A4P9ZVI5_9FUNG|nr:hypothetical protein BJ085DRAFT_40345 [Dimargaris cristalligena]|eukprot:RKP37614.1 hypothetical protein BJ085DRAFT_40345 [Dimargaris cristalligena]
MKPIVILLRILAKPSADERIRCDALYQLLLSFGYEWDTEPAADTATSTVHPATTSLNPFKMTTAPSPISQRPSLDTWRMDPRRFISRRASQDPHSDEVDDYCMLLEQEGPWQQPLILMAADLFTPGLLERKNQLRTTTTATTVDPTAFDADTTDPTTESNSATLAMALLEHVLYRQLLLSTAGDACVVQTIVHLWATLPAGNCAAPFAGRLLYRLVRRLNYNLYGPGRRATNLLARMEPVQWKNLGSLVQLSMDFLFNHREYSTHLDENWPALHQQIATTLATGNGSSHGGSGGDYPGSTGLSSSALSFMSLLGVLAPVGGGHSQFGGSSGGGLASGGRSFDLLGDMVGSSGGRKNSGQVVFRTPRNPWDDQPKFVLLLTQFLICMSESYEAPGNLCHNALRLLVHGIQSAHFEHFRAIAQLTMRLLERHPPLFKGTAKRTPLSPTMFVGPDGHTFMSSHTSGPNSNGCVDDPALQEFYCQRNCGIQTRILALVGYIHEALVFVRGSEPTGSEEVKRQTQELLSLYMYVFHRYRSYLIDVCQPSSLISPSANTLPVRRSAHTLRRPTLPSDGGGSSADLAQMLYNPSEAEKAPTNAYSRPTGVSLSLPRGGGGPPSPRPRSTSLSQNSPWTGMDTDARIFEKFIQSPAWLEVYNDFCLDSMKGLEEEEASHFPHKIQGFMKMVRDGLVEIRHSENILTRHRRAIKLSTAESIQTMLAAESNRWSDLERSYYQSQGTLWQRWREFVLPLVDDHGPWSLASSHPLALDIRRQLNGGSQAQDDGRALLIDHFLAPSWRWCFPVVLQAPERHWLVSGLENRSRMRLSLTPNEFFDPHVTAILRRDKHGPKSPVGIHFFPPGRGPAGLMSMRTDSLGGSSAARMPLLHTFYPLVLSPQGGYPAPYGGDGRSGAAMAAGTGAGHTRRLTDPGIRTRRLTSATSRSSLLKMTPPSSASSRTHSVSIPDGRTEVSGTALDRTRAGSIHQPPASSTMHLRGPSSVSVSMEEWGWVTTNYDVTTDRQAMISAGGSTDMDDLDEAYSKHTFSVYCELVLNLHSTRGHLKVTDKTLRFYPEANSVGEASGDPADTSAGATGGSSGSGGGSSGGAAGTSATLPPVLTHELLRIRSWPLGDLTSIHFRRYKLRKSAVELFFATQTSFFFNFPHTKDRTRFCAKVTTVNSRCVMYTGLKSPKVSRELHDMTQRWQRRELSNFDYLMGLNTLAGRSYNDMTQYPVFPWIIKDYTSDTLDLNDPERTFRDLTKPVGALNPDRLRRYIERYHGFEDPTGVVKKFHYGTHYSTAASVAHFLIRLEPFTSVHIGLQSGKFDHADRQFHSIAEAWQSCTKGSGDVKELIPEFFYLPEFLTNGNHWNLGRKQDGTTLGDVQLPPWASSPTAFIRMHRAALESDYVSTHLHHWIDLIFGFQQTGQAAVDAHNVFYYLTYEDAVDVDTIANPVDRRSAENQIHYFGQTPSQLFATPHVQRYTPAPSPLTDYMFISADAVAHGGRAEEGGSYTNGVPVERRQTLSEGRKPSSYRPSADTTDTAVDSTPSATTLTFAETLQLPHRQQPFAWSLFHPDCPTKTFAIRTNHLGMCAVMARPIPDRVGDTWQQTLVMVDNRGHCRTHRLVFATTNPSFRFELDSTVRLLPDVLSTTPLSMATHAQMGIAANIPPPPLPLPMHSALSPMFRKLSGPLRLDRRGLHDRLASFCPYKHQLAFIASPGVLIVDTRHWDGAIRLREAGLYAGAQGVRSEAIRRAEALETALLGSLVDLGQSMSVPSSPLVADNGGPLVASRNHSIRSGFVHVDDGRTSSVGSLGLGAGDSTSTLGLMSGDGSEGEVAAPPVQPIRSHQFATQATGIFALSSTFTTSATSAATVPVSSSGSGPASSTPPTSGPSPVVALTSALAQDPLQCVHASRNGAWLVAGTQNGLLHVYQLMLKPEFSPTEPASYSLDLRIDCARDGLFVAAAAPGGWTPAASAPTQSGVQSTVPLRTLTGRTDRSLVGGDTHADTYVSQVLGAEQLYMNSFGHYGKPHYCYSTNRHQAPVTEVVVAAEYNLVVSGDAAGRCIMWTLLTGQYNRTLDPAALLFSTPYYTGQWRVELIQISSRGDLIIYSRRVSSDTPSYLADGGDDLEPDEDDEPTASVDALLSVYNVNGSLVGYHLFTEAPCYPRRNTQYIQTYDRWHDLVALKGRYDTLACPAGWGGPAAPAITVLPGIIDMALTRHGDYLVTVDVFHKVAIYDLDALDFPERKGGPARSSNPNSPSQQPPNHLSQAMGTDTEMEMAALPSPAHIPWVRVFDLPWLPSAVALSLTEQQIIVTGSEGQIVVIAVDDPN